MRHEAGRKTDTLTYVSLQTGRVNYISRPHSQAYLYPYAVYMVPRADAIDVLEATETGLTVRQ